MSTDATIAARIAAAVATARQEILDDIASGIVPASVADYSALHNYVDANMYGGDDMDALWDDRPEVDPYVHIAAMQQAVDEWLKAGGVAAAGLSPIVCRYCGAEIVSRPAPIGWALAADKSPQCTEGGAHSPRD